MTSFFCVSVNTARNLSDPAAQNGGQAGLKQCSSHLFRGLTMLTLQPKLKVLRFTGLSQWLQDYARQFTSGIAPSQILRYQMLKRFFLL
jgi:hypothetical protein